MRPLGVTLSALAAVLAAVCGFAAARWTADDTHCDYRASETLKAYNYDTVAADFDTVGNNRIWQAEQEPSNNGQVQRSRIRVVRDAPGPTGQPRPAGNVLRVELRPFANETGDVTETTTVAGNRAEVYDRQPAEPDTPADAWADPAGSTRWYGFDVYLPPDWAFAGVDRHSA